MAAPPEAGALFDEFYYAHCCGQPYGRTPALQAFFGSIADRIVADFAPTRVLDAGCAIGLLVEALHNRGVAAEGIDISAYAIAQVPPALAQACRVGSLVDPLPHRYDLIVNIEVLEHMPPREADQAIASLTAQTDAILFSSSPFDLREPTHQSVRPPEAWAEAFARHGFLRDVDYDAGYITAWATLFRRDGTAGPALVRRYERWGFARDYAAREVRAHALKTQATLASTQADATALRAQVTGLEHRLADETRVVTTLRADLAARLGELSEAHTRVATLQTALADANGQAAVQAAAYATAQTAAAANAAAAHQALDVTTAECRRLAAALADAQATIRAMERSLFWKARTPWAWLSGRLRGR